ncbi:MAG: AAA family ATPase, partial [Spirochaetales bacterium]|nr:AAA family ATPase [Spirochaetales bacterium]
IQASPRAVTSLRDFYEESPAYHVVSAGSLLGVSVSRVSSFPVGKVNFMMLYPLSFFEYLSAVKENLLIEFLEEKANYLQMEKIIHEKLLKYYKMFLFLGGNA